ncbi:7 kDa protein [Tobacco necrosis virus D]|uniref:7 kDa protein n=1 Tax=Tobacco necrosis virus (strain D) TaxID=12056 RepID=O41349_TNVD|nr:7 kDa protein [Tobacco necrosis virus D]AAC57949.1 7 kDa protein [Tobacco necrosis virus D]ASA69344.1 p7a [Tobacco necrosis virus D]QYA72316.1 ORF3 [Tobacco necrosis virus D]
MENSENVRSGRQNREYSRDRQQEGGYKEISKAAVRKEGDVKQDMGPSVSMTVVGEKVEFTQHFHF